MTATDIEFALMNHPDHRMWSGTHEPALPRSSRLRWRRRTSLCAGAVVAVLLVDGLAVNVPNRRAVELEHRAVTAMRASHYGAAEQYFAGVLRREPRSTFSRLGLACVFYLTGHRSRALLELTMGLNRGLVPGHIAGCGRSILFDRLFIVAKLRLTDSFAVPRLDGESGYERWLTSLPSSTSSDAAHRLLIGSCLAFRAGLAAAGWYYAANANSTASVSPTMEREFFTCIGPSTATRLGCPQPPHLDNCVFDRQVHNAYLDDEPYLYPADAPSAFANAP